MQAIIFSTGEELLNGISQDKNAPYIARELAANGFTVKRHEILGDDEAQLSEQLRRAAKDAEVILLTGGLGPTADDRTRRAVAKTADRQLVPDREALQHVKNILDQYGVQFEASHRQQAMFPEGAKTFANTRGTAYGFACPVGQSTLVAMPGVPDEMRVMFQDLVLPYLCQKHQSGSQTRKVHLFGISESAVDHRIKDLMEKGRNPSVGITVDHSIVTICLRAWGHDPEHVKALLDRDEKKLRCQFGDAIFGINGTTLAESVSKLLEATQLRIAVAESCTGGDVGSLLVDVPGISRFFLLDVVAYSNRAKTTQLSVPEAQIERYGAVSSEVAASMARGICDASEAELGVSTTGIAGPTGGRPGKPVGLVHLGVCLHGQTTTRELRLQGNRQRVKDRAARHALNFARMALVDYAQ